MNKNRIIMHIDMNCFFASCERIENKFLIGKPIVVAHNDPLDRGLIVSPSYEARKFGIKATMHVNEAKVLCPSVIVVPPNYALYQKYSKLFYELLLTITPFVEMASIDEAFIDVTHLNLGVRYLDLAKAIQKSLLDKYNLPTSIGISPNKYLAKMASDMKKPLGITILRKKDVKEKMWPLDIKEMLFIGKKSSEKLREIGINTIGELALYKDLDRLERVMGKRFIESMIPKCYGIDDSPVITDYGKQTSISSEHTFMNLCYKDGEVYDILKTLAIDISYRLKKEKLLCLNVGIKLNDGKYNNITRSEALVKETNEVNDIYYKAQEIFDEYFDENSGVRLIGIFCSRLIEKNMINTQISIFDDFKKLENEERINKLINDFNKQSGKNLLYKGNDIN